MYAVKTTNGIMIQTLINADFGPLQGTKRKENLQETNLNVYKELIHITYIR